MPIVKAGISPLGYWQKVNPRLPKLSLITVPTLHVNTGKRFPGRRDSWQQLPVDSRGAAHCRGAEQSVGFSPSGRNVVSRIRHELDSCLFPHPTYILPLRVSAGPERKAHVMVRPWKAGNYLRIGNWSVFVLLG